MSPSTPVADALAPYVAYFWEWGVPVVIVLLAVPFLTGGNLRGKAGESRVTTILRRLTAEVRDDVLLPDGRGGLTQVDHMALTPAGIWAVETKDYSGLIFGREREKTWTQKLGNRTYRFQNPLHQNFGHVRALETALPGTPIQGLVVFTDRARFPRGEPAGVVRIEDLAAAMAAQAGEGLCRSSLGPNGTPFAIGCGRARLSAMPIWLR